MTTAVRPHEFNTRWWGAPVGIVGDAAFLARPAPEREAALAPFDWVEFRGHAPGGPLAAAALGFAQVDVQIPFRIGLHLVPVTPSVEALGVRFGDEAPLSVPAGEMMEFRHERFSALPGMTPGRLADRYARWSAELIAAHPAACLAVTRGDRVEGWFLSRPLDGRLQLTLAMLRRDAGIPGALLYQKALVAHARRGARIGEASFSASNADVLNIYARLGARFLPAEPCHLWLNPRLRPESP